jgi:hypothetical protein
MAIDERARHQLYLRLEEHLGAEAASTLMEHLPPTGWADVATKRDLDQATALLKADLDQYTALLKGDLGAFKAELEKSIERTRADLLKTISTHTVAIVFTMVATILAGLFAVAQIR